MTPCLWTGFYGDLPFEQALRRMHAAGWRCVEVSTEHLRELRTAKGGTAGQARSPSPESLARWTSWAVAPDGDGSGGWWHKAVGEAKNLLDELGIEAPQAHAHLSANFANDEEEKRERDLAIALEELPICAGLGVRTVVLHPGRSDAGREVTLERSARAFARVAEQAGELGLAVAVENMRTPAEEGEKGTRFGSFLEDLFDLIEEVGAPNLGICLDTGHAHNEGLDLAEAVRAAASALRAIHVADNDGERDLHLHPFYGSVDWLPFVAALREVGFDGPFNLEIGGFARVNVLEAKDAKCRHARELAELLTSGTLLPPA